MDETKQQITVLLRIVAEKSRKKCDETTVLDLERKPDEMLSHSLPSCIMQTV